jgi:transcription initiation factor TFIIH subunit 2
MAARSDAFTWERTYERPWEAIEEDERGFLKVDGFSGGRRAAAARAAAAAPQLAAVQRGLLRHVLLVLDCSSASEATDLRPSRAEAMASACTTFIRGFFDQNPISSLGLLRVRRGVADKLTDLGGNPAKHVAALAAAMRPCDCGARAVECACRRRREGDFSFENALVLALDVLTLQPAATATREVVIVHSAIASCDPGDVFDAVRRCAEQGVRVSVVSLPAEVHLATRIAALTGGACAVPENEEHLQELLLAHQRPPPRRAAGAAAGAARAGGMVLVGFPEQEHETEALCTCHQALRGSTFVCPRCRAHCCDIPCECEVCGLRLISAPALARSYHHIFPVPAFREVPPPPPAAAAAGEGGGGGAAGGSSSAAAAAASAAAEGGEASPPELCVACVSPLAGESHWVCPDCALPFCGTCNATIHETLHSCPGCSSEA